LTGLETESPRGRLFLIRALADGTQTVNAQFIEHINLCLDCRNCETVCPSGVHYGAMLEAARGEIVTRDQAGMFERAMRWIVLKQIWTRPKLFDAFVALFKFYQRVGLQKFLRATGALKLFGRLGEMETMLPASRPLHAFRARPSPPSPVPIPYPNVKSEPRAEPTKTVALFTGCIMRAGFGNLHDATIRVLEKNGWRVDVMDAQVCCGALHIHAGERELAQEMARKNIAAFENRTHTAIVVNAAGCGAALKESGELLRDDPAFAQRAKEFSARVKDVTELLAQSPLTQPGRALSARVTYQEPCHLAHAQRIKKQPRDLLKQIPGVELIEMKASDRCCGSAGIYNVTHPEIANPLIDEKMANVIATRADIVVTANIGCLLQLESGKTRSRWNGRVAHIIELLDEAYQR
jgi:glycolate oxidase iron-sulfur subunit